MARITKAVHIPPLKNPESLKNLHAFNACAATLSGDGLQLRFLMPSSSH